jgi:hypothetical protein
VMKSCNRCLARLAPIIVRVLSARGPTPLSLDGTEALT